MKVTVRRMLYLASAVAIAGYGACSTCPGWRAR
jgi:hypothetical protein